MPFEPPIIRRAPFGREPGGLNTSPTVKLNAAQDAAAVARPQPTIVQSFLPSDRIPGNFGEARSVQLADLPLQPTNPRELAQGIQSRQAFLVSVPLPGFMGLRLLFWVRLVRAA